MKILNSLKRFVRMVGELCRKNIGQAVRVRWKEHGTEIPFYWDKKLCRIVLKRLVESWNITSVYSFPDAGP